MTPRAMTVAGSDSGGGAGIQADLKTFLALGVYGTTAIAAITAQNTLGVRSVHEIPTSIIADQIDAILEDIGTDAAKTGMLSSAEIIGVVAERLRHWRVDRLVVDPVMVATSGDRLLREDAVEALIGELLPLALVLTPNLPEAEVLVGRSLQTDDEIRQAARDIVDIGPRAVLMKGGHREGDATDVLFDGQTFYTFAAERIETPNTHGTGCTLSAAIAAGLAGGLDLVEAVGSAKRYLTEALRHAQPLGRGHGPVAMVGSCVASRWVSEIEIRAQEPSDASALHEIYGRPAVYANTLQLPWRSFEPFRERLTQPETGVHRFVALIDGKLVGALGLEVVQNPRRSDCASIGMAVHDEYHNRGVGSALMAAMVELADNWLGLRRIELTVWTDNLAAIHLYEKFGFVIEGTGRQYARRAGQLVDAFFMARVRAG